MDNGTKSSREHKTAVTPSPLRLHPRRPRRIDICTIRPLRDLAKIERNMTIRYEIEHAIEEIENRKRNSVPRRVQ